MLLTNKKKIVLRVLPLIALFVAIVLFSGFYAVATRYVQKPVLPDGAFIDDIAVGGMRAEHARQFVEESFEKRIAGKSIRVESDGFGRSFTYSDAGAHIAIDDALAKIKALSDGELLSQLDNKLMAKSGYYTNAVVLYDKESLRLAVEEFANEAYTAPVDATVVFSEEGAFSFTQEQSGSCIDADAITELLYAQFTLGNLATIDVEKTELMPAITKSLLTQHTNKLGSASTKVFGSPERIMNICLITDAVNGCSVMPGETLSLNALTGERTPEKGYMQAPAIRYGELIEEIGGGICQLSGTLFNAALLSNLEILERHHHTWPSDYLPIGLDATITWPNKDLKVRNNTNWPVYIHATVIEDALTVTFYGEQRNGDLRIELENNIYETVAPPPPVLVPDDTRPEGYKRVINKERAGYHVRVYRNYYKGDTLAEKELIHTDRFYPIAGKYIVGTFLPLVMPGDEEK